VERIAHRAHEAKLVRVAVAAGRIGRLGGDELAVDRLDLFSLLDDGRWLAQCHLLVCWVEMEFFRSFL
jgi:hypothetical protein